MTSEIFEISGCLFIVAIIFYYFVLFAKSIRNIKKIVSIFLLLLIASAFALLFVIPLIYITAAIKDSDPCYKVDTSWKEIVGELVELDHGGSGGASKFSYKYDSKWFLEYSITDLNVLGNAKGEKYMILVNPSSPKCYIPIDYKPVFETGEQTATTLGTVIYIGDAGFFDGIIYKKKASIPISFFYTINEEAHMRGQQLLRNYKNIYPSLVVGNKYVVEYLITDPERAIIHLDKPIDNL